MRQREREKGEEEREEERRDHVHVEASRVLGLEQNPEFRFSVRTYA